MKDYIINVVSYKRPENNTCKLLNETDLNWRVFVYYFDPYLEEYTKKYSNKVYIIKEFDKPNLSKKRQLTLDVSIKEHYDYCFMLDDDIESIEYVDTLYKDKLRIAEALSKLYLDIKSTNYIALSAAYNKSDTNEEISEYKNICNNSIFNLSLYQKAKDKGIIYNENSKCEDMEFSMELFLHGFKSGRLNSIIIHNILQGGTTNDGLSYRFKEKNRFIEESSYMIQKYPQYKDIFECSENHFKFNSNKLKELLHENKII